ncbi:MAG: dihydrodipicolinate synthase family protein [Planctomycetota bacterium]
MSPAEADPGPRTTGASPFAGSIVALPTPFAHDAVDLAALDRLVQHQTAARTHGVTVGGTTGEGWSLNLDETVQITSRVVAAAGRPSGRELHVVGQVTEVDSRRAAQLAEQMVHSGVEGLLVGVPPLVQPGEVGVLRHLERVFERLPWTVPVALLNEPSRTGTDLTIEITERASREFEFVCAHCEGVGFPGRARRLARDSFLDVLSGDDRMLGPYLRSGAIGAVNVVGNLVPGEVRALFESGDDERDSRERALGPLIDALRAGPHPVPLKETLGLLGAIDCEVRAPLVPLGATELGELRTVLELARLLVPERAHG